MATKYPRMELAEFESAVEVLGVKIARIADAIAVEEGTADPDKNKIAALVEQSRELRDLQDDLEPGDPRVGLIHLDKPAPIGDIDFWEEALALANTTPEDAAFTAYLDQHGHGGGDA